jgi:hypothetical protein
MRFTTKQYDEAIESLRSARKQLEPDGQNCACCGDGGHQAFECGHNPLVAMVLCKAISDSAAELHEHLHYLAGCNVRMGEPIGPATVRAPSID